MKTSIKKTSLTMIFTITVLSGAVLLSACGSSPSAAEAQAMAGSARISAQAEQAADAFRVVDWQNRSIGEIASPVWLLPAVRGNWNMFKNEWPVSPDRVLRIGVARHATLNGARTVADVQYAANLANQLRQAVLTRAAISLDSAGEFDVVNNAATQAQVNIAGQERMTDFWQLVETTGQDGRTTRVYQYYVVYSSDAAVWNQLVAKYLHDVVGVLPDSRTQQTMAGMFNEINAEIQRERTEAQFNAELAARQQALREPPRTSSELYIAFQSSDPAQQAAAATTPADADYVAALAALAGASEM